MMRLKGLQNKSRSRGVVQVLNVQQAPRPPLQSKPPEQRTSRVPGHKSIARAAQLTLEDRLALVQGLNLTKQGRNAQARTDSPVSIEHDVSDDSVYIPAATRTPPEPTASQEADTVYVFSYGSNLSWEAMNKKDVQVLSRDPAFICDNGVRLVFKHRGGHASLEKLPAGSQPKFKPCGAAGGPCVHGVLYRVPKACLKHVQPRDHGYIMTAMQVETYDGLQVEAKVFVSGPLNRLPEEVTPPEAYMRKLREGAAFNFLAPQYQAWLSSIETVPSAGLPVEYYNTPSRLKFPGKAR